MSEKPYPPSHRAQKFLVVDVKKGASKQDVLIAIEKALESDDVPFLKGAPKPHGAITSRAAAEELSAEYVTALAASGPSTPSSPQDTLLMLVRQEGWP